ncbi:PREDICTED: cubilin-like [Papilio polytes]|uniref:cubilin-like n=1 Tax=Papilio polytes TaxID=76194 RepID=UPI0006762A82|nr:PREDICTED: cubilin-like [Papilio polytes]
MNQSTPVNSTPYWFPGWRKHSSQPNDDGTSGQDCVEARRDFPPRPPAPQPTYMWNDRSCHEHNYYVCEVPSIEDPYTASKIQCNETIVLTHSHPHAIVSSPGFPRPYPDDVDCVAEVRAPPAHTLRLHFEELLTEHEPQFKHLKPHIKNDVTLRWNLVWEEMGTLLPESDSISAGWRRDSGPGSGSRRVCGDWSGKLKLLRYQSRSNALRLRFRTDHSGHYAGFRAKITVADSQTCMDAKQVLFNGHCYLFSGYPRASWTTAKQVCEGLNMHLSSVHSAEEERFIISGIRQSSDYSAGAVYWLGARVQRPGGNFSWVDGSIFEYQAWPPYNDTEDIEEPCLGVQWRTSPVPSQPSGLYWTQHKCVVTGGYVCKRRLNPEHILKNNTVEGNSGELSSPNHPGLYDNEVDYWVQVAGPPDTRLVFVFKSIDLEYQNDCLYDYVELKDGLTTKSSRYCGSLGETRWVATSNLATLHFHSDYNTQGSGFSLSWRAVELAGCPSQTFTSKEGQLRSPNFPHFLLPGLDCTIHILAPSGKRVFLNISHFDFGYGTFANGVPVNVSEVIPEDTFLEVQIDPDSAPIRTFVNPNILTNGIFVSKSEMMRLRLRTGENVTGAGFLAVFKTGWYLY